MSILQVSNVNKSFAGLRALNEVNLEVQEGAVHAIIGPNGAGKSTLLNCFVGRLEPDTGSVQFNGVSLLGLSPHKINQAGVCRVFQTPEIFGDLTLLQNMMIPTLAKRDGAFRLNAWDRVDGQAEITEKSEHLLEDVGLIEKRDVKADFLSRGDKRRLELAMCLVQDPKLLLLDEPTAGLSPLFMEEIFERVIAVNETGVGILMVEQNARQALGVAHRGYVLSTGENRFADTGPALLANREVVESFLGG